MRGIERHYELGFYPQPACNTGTGGTARYPIWLHHIAKRHRCPFVGCGYAALYGTVGYEIETTFLLQNMSIGSWSFTLYSRLDRLGAKGTYSAGGFPRRFSGCNTGDD